MKDLKNILIGLAPALAPIFIFTFYPVFYAIYVSLFRFNLKYPEPYGFIGGLNYVEMTQTYYFQYSLRSTAIFAIMAIPVIVIGSLLLSILITRKFRGAGFLQWLVLIPWDLKQEQTVLNRLAFDVFEQLFRLWFEPRSSQDPHYKNCDIPPFINIRFFIKNQSVIMKIS